MDSDPNFDVLLSFIGSQEKDCQSVQFYKNQYEPLVLDTLENEGQSHLFEEDLLSQYKGKSIEEILREHPSIKQGKINRRNPNKRNELCPVYYDTLMPLYIKQQHKSYDKFFAYLLKHTDLMKLDLCLDYQLENHYENKLTNFSRFLHLVIRKYKGEILSENTSVTIQEWISLKEKQRLNESLTKSESLRKRKGLLRQGDDKLTSLNREQTVLLIYYLQAVKVFLRDEYLTDTDAGRAFELLTGYSSNTIRQGLTKFMSYQNNHNLFELKRVLQQMVHKVEKDIASLV